MNKKRRYVLQVVIDNLERLRYQINKEEAQQIIQDSIDKIQMCADDEEEAYDNLPESLQYAALGENLSDNVSDLEDAVGDLECVQAVYEDTAGQVSYDAIKSDMISAVNSITEAINRR